MMGVYRHMDGLMDECDLKESADGLNFAGWLS